MLHDLDLTPALSRLPRHPQARTIPLRTEPEAWATLHYSGVPGERYADRSAQAELARIVAETRYQLQHNYGTADHPAYPDGYLYDAVILSDGRIVRTRTDRRQLWHVGNSIGNARSWSIHVALGVGQDLTDAQRSGLWRLLDSLSVPLVGHCEWPRGTGLPVPDRAYRVQSRQSACPGPVLHRQIVAYRERSTASYTADAPIMGQPRGTRDQARHWLTQRSTHYSPQAVDEIVTGYATIGASVGVDWFLALAQCAHETGSLTSWWCDRPRRNPAGLGVTGHSVPGAPDVPPPGAWAWRGNRWREGLSFARWVPDAIVAHVGRLVAYAVPPSERFGPQVAIADAALRLRPLPLALQGSAPTLAGLDGRWAVPGDGYGGRIASLANRMRGEDG